MFDLYAAEQQYRHDTGVRQREHALLASIRERTAPAARLPTRVTRTPAPRPVRTAWPRPIGLRTSAESSAACAAA
jgi:hypothetical protein